VLLSREGAPLDIHEDRAADAAQAERERPAD
jgi:hypothetical protein